MADYPEDVPATLERVAAMDRAGGWGRVSYETTSDTWRVDADLWIGANNGTETYFQIGTARHPRESLVINGQLVVHPARIKGENPAAEELPDLRRVNRLTLGDPANTAIVAMLKIDSRAGSEHSLWVGSAGTNTALRGSGAQLHVYHSTITAATPDKEHAFGSPPNPRSGDRVVFLGGDQMVFKHATYAWAAGLATYGLNASYAVLGDSVFEHCGTVLYNDGQRARRCVFRDCETAVMDAGGLIAELTECVLERNQVNWLLGYNGHRLVCEDCDIQPPLKGNIYRLGSDPQKAAYFQSRRHLVVAVVDPAGQPVPGALVNVDCEQGRAALVDNGSVRTDATGRTPGREARTPLLLTERQEQAAPAGNQPLITTYSYVIKVTAAGYAPAALTGFRPTNSWAVLRVELKK